MLSAYLKLAMGAILVICSFRLTMVRLRQALENILPGWRVIPKIVSVVTFVVAELIGMNLLIDPMVPGQALISVDAREHMFMTAVPAALRVEIAVANIDGSLDKETIYRGRLDANGIYTALVSFDWFQSYARIRLYESANPQASIVEEWKHISPWARIGFTDERVMIRQRNSR
jgi:hypothetical protein